MGLSKSYSIIYKCKFKNLNPLKFSIPKAIYSLCVHDLCQANDLCYVAYISIFGLSKVLLYHMQLQTQKF